MTESKEQIQAPGFNPSPEFLVRQKRLDDAMYLRKPDRVPLAPIVVMFYPTNEKGLPTKTAMYDHKTAFKAWKEVTLQYDWDAAPPPGSILSGKLLDIMGVKQLKWPGGTLTGNQPFQWVEGEYIKQDEYDEVLKDPNGFAVKKLWPRICSTLAPLGEMAQGPPLPLLYISEGYSLPFVFGEILSNPSMKELLKKAMDLADAYEEFKNAGMDYSFEMMRLGYPLIWNAVSFVAFDHVSDYYRGMRGSMIDMFKAPEKLLDLVEMLIPYSIGNAVMMAQKTGSKTVFVPMHRGAAGFMSDKQFEKFYWPSFKALMLGLIDAGLTPIPVFEGDYNPRLDYLAELPKGKIVGHFDVIDREKAKEKIGDVMCFWGNVPGSLMCTGTPRMVKDNVKELIDIFGKDGGLIIDGALGIPDEARPENVRALTEAVLEYGS